MSVFQNRNTALQTMTLATHSTPDQVVLSPTTPLYMLNGILRKGYVASGVIDLDPAFAASTIYQAGTIIVEGTNIYSAKTTFTSGSAFDANDWYLLDVNSIATGYQRLYIVGYVYNRDLGTHSIALKTMAQQADPFNDGGLALTADLYNMEFNMAEALNSLQEDKDFAVVGYFLVRNQSGSAFVPGTTSLATSDVFVYYGSRDSESDE